MRILADQAGTNRNYQAGHALGQRWARSCSSPQRQYIQSWVSLRMEVDTWDPVSVYVDLLTHGMTSNPPSNVSSDEPSRLAEQQRQAALRWWRDLAGTDWPDDDDSVPNFVKGFAFGAAAACFAAK
jgi:hypothetical protein